MAGWSWGTGMIMMSSTDLFVTPLLCAQSYSSGLRGEEPTYWHRYRFYTLWIYMYIMYKYNEGLLWISIKQIPFIFPKNQGIIKVLPCSQRAKIWWTTPLFPWSKIWNSNSNRRGGCTTRTCPTTRPNGSTSLRTCWPLSARSWIMGRPTWMCSRRPRPTCSTRCRVRGIYRCSYSCECIYYVCIEQAYVFDRHAAGYVIWYIDVPICMDVDWIEYILTCICICFICLYLLSTTFMSHHYYTYIFIYKIIYYI